MIRPLISFSNRKSFYFNAAVRNSCREHSADYLSYGKIVRYVDRDRWILNTVRGASVLHIGCVGFTDLSDAERVRLAPETLHWRLSQQSDVIGVDYSREVVEAYRKEGIFDNILIGDAERLEELPLKRSFDFILAGDIIEHLANPGLVLTGARRFCHADTRLLLTTPNAHGLPGYLRFALRRFSDGDEHVTVFHEQALRKLLHRCGWKLVEVGTCYQRNALRYGFFFRLGRAFFQVAPQFGGTLYAVAVPATPPEGSAGLTNPKRPATVE